MPELNTILRDRLGAMEDPKDHPDPDTLTAYVEELLPATERRNVFEHLSLCRQCREVVMLTLPERAVAAEAPEEETVPAVAALPEPRRWWFLTPQFGLAASLVAVAAGVFLVLKIPQMQKQAPTQTASLTQRQDAPPPAPTTPSESVATRTRSAEPEQQPNLLGRSFTSGPVSRAEDKVTALAAVAPAKKSLLPAQNQPVSGSGQRDYINNQVLANQLFAADVVSVPQPLEQLPSAPRAPRPTFSFSQPGLSQNGSGTLSTAFLAPPSAAGGSQSTFVVYPDRQNGRLMSKITSVGRQLHLKRQIPMISSERAGEYAMFSPGLAKSESSEMTAKAAETGSATELGQSSAFTSSGLRGRPSALDLGANSFLWRVAQGKLLKSSDMEHWLDGYPTSEGIEFSMVTASGAEVWAGGKDAALIHSGNGGLTWERITLGASATGSITTIEVNRSTIRVKSSSGQGWLSKDGGRSWTLQD